MASIELLTPGPSIERPGRAPAAPGDPELSSGLQAGALGVRLVPGLVRAGPTAAGLGLAVRVLDLDRDPAMGAGGPVMGARAPGRVLAGPARAGSATAGSVRGLVSLAWAPLLPRLAAHTRPAADRHTAGRKPCHRAPRPPEAAAARRSPGDRPGHRARDASAERSTAAEDRGKSAMRQSACVAGGTGLPGNTGVAVARCGSLDSRLQVPRHRHRRRLA